uniref:Uncharacterized protein n=1 Tax=Plectus sambesii TaxID=2011161 RepID=A0A914UPE5_9BILA
MLRTSDAGVMHVAASMSPCSAARAQSRPRRPLSRIRGMGGAQSAALPSAAAKRRIGALVSIATVILLFSLSLLSESDIRPSSMVPFETDQPVFTPYKSAHAYNCSAIFDGKLAVIRKAQRYMSIKMFSPYIAPVKDKCAEFPLINHPHLPEEVNFPIAYSILAFRNFDQFFRLFTAIYRPWNSYCIHVDSKASPEMFAKVSQLVDCLPNTILTPVRENVKWGRMTVLSAALHCFRSLIEERLTWRYLLNIAASDYPLKSNLEIVRHLVQLEGKSDVETLARKDEWKYQYSYRNAEPVELVSNGQCIKYFNSNRLELDCPALPLKGNPPHGLEVHKGSFSVALERQFVVYLLYDRVALDFLHWLGDVYIPDEYFWSTLYYSTYAARHGLTTNETTFMVRYTHWGDQRPLCTGYYEHGLCVFGVGDLKWLTKRAELFAHKFDRDTQPVALDCMEERIWNRTWSPHLSDFAVTAGD